MVCGLEMTEIEGHSTGSCGLGSLNGKFVQEHNGDPLVAPTIDPRRGLLLSARRLQSTHEKPTWTSHMWSSRPVSFSG